QRLANPIWGTVAVAYWGSSNRPGRNICWLAARFAAGHRPRRGGCAAPAPLARPRRCCSGEPVWIGGAGLRSLWRGAVERAGLAASGPARSGKAPYRPASRRNQLDAGQHGCRLGSIATTPAPVVPADRHHVVRRRLLQCRAALASPITTKRSVADIAFG